MFTCTTEWIVGNSERVSAPDLPPQRFHVGLRQRSISQRRAFGPICWVLALRNCIALRSGMATGLRNAQFGACPVLGVPPGRYAK